MDIDQKPPNPVSCGKQHSGLELSGTNLVWMIVSDGGWNPADG